MELFLKDAKNDEALLNWPVKSIPAPVIDQPEKAAPTEKMEEEPLAESPISPKSSTGPVLSIDMSQTAAIPTIQLPPESNSTSIVEEPKEQPPKKPKKTKSKKKRRYHL